MIRFSLYLGRHVFDSACVRFIFFLGSADACNSEVNNFNSSVFSIPEQDIFEFEISVDDTFAMTVVHSSEDL